MLFTIWPPRGQSVSSYSVQYRSSQTCKWPKIWITTKMQMCPDITLWGKSGSRSGIFLDYLWTLLATFSEKKFMTPLTFFWNKLREGGRVKPTTFISDLSFWSHSSRYIKYIVDLNIQICSMYPGCNILLNWQKWTFLIRSLIYFQYS